MTTGEKIRGERKRMGLTQTELGARLGVQKNAVSKWERGRVEPGAAKVRAMAALFGVPAAELMGDGPEEDGLEGAMRPYRPTRRIPILGRISAGQPLYAEQNIEGYTWTDLNGGGEYFALRVTGDSMTAARIYDGDVLIVRRQDIVDDGQIAVVLVGDDEATVKRFYRRGSTVTLMPQSVNPVHRPQVYDARRTQIRVIGRVVGSQIEF